MKKYLLILIICLCSIQTFYSQEDDGVVSLAIPTRNSLSFNRYTINPTFSFVREQTKYISVYNKREWVQFENAPLTYLASYSGRFGENIGAGLGLFQQNYGVLTTFGGILNFAYNARLGQDSNLTFGINIGAYKSGVNAANVVTNFDDPSLQNVPENFLLTINPGINYGTEFFDFGFSINNLALYNFESSSLIEDNQQQSVQAHAMYTGYMNSKGFFDNSKFTGLLRYEVFEERNIYSALAMISVPKGIWMQGGYNSFYGVSGGVGINLTKQIAIEYNYENSIGKFLAFGSSHEITLAYRFKNDKYYDYSREDEVSSILSGENKKRRVSKTSKPRVAGRQATNDTKTKADANAKLVAEQNVKAKLAADQQAELAKKEDAEAQAKLIETQKAKELDQIQAELDKIEADKKALQIAETRARLQAEEKLKQEAIAQSKLLAKQKAKQQLEAQAKLDKAEADNKIQEDARLLVEQKAKDKADEEATKLAKQKAQNEAAAQAKLLEAQKLKEQLEAQAKRDKIEAAKKAQEEAKLLTEQKAKDEAEKQAAILEEQKVKEQLEAQAKRDKIEADKIVQEEEDEKTALLVEQKAQAEADKKATDEAISNPTDAIAKSMQSITKSTEDSKVSQNDLLKKFDDIVAIKDKDLKDLKEENDLSDQGITVQPRAFKSVTAENNTLNAIKIDLDNVIKTRNDKIDELNKLYDERTKVVGFELDEVSLFYKKEIKRLTSEQLKANEIKAKLDTKLEAIRVATEFEKRRRIKRAAFNNEEDRYSQDRALLKNIKVTTALSDTPLKAEDFDFGEVQGNNIQILKNIENIENGYYLIIAVHSDIKRRNEFVTNVVAAGRTDVDFFHDVTTSKYYIFYDKFENIGEANTALASKGDRPYNGKMSIVKIENQ